MLYNANARRSGIGFAPLRFLLFVGIVTGIPTLMVSGCLLNARHTLAARTDAIRLSGEPTTPAELDRWYTAVPDAENAAIPLADALAILHRIDDPKNGDDPTSPIMFLAKPAIRSGAEAIPIDLSRSFAPLLSKRKSYVAKLREASQRPSCRFPVSFERHSGYFASSATSDLRQVQGFITLAAALEADEGQRDAAFADLIATIRLSDVLRNEPLWASQYFRLNARRTACWAVEFAGNRVTFVDQQLSSLIETIGRLEDPDLAYRAIVGERCEVLSFYRHHAVTWSQTTEAFVSLHPYVAAWKAVHFLDTTDRLLPASRLDSVSRRHTASVVDRANREYQVRASPWKEFSDTYTQGFLSSIRILIEYHDQDTALWAVTRVALAAERYRLAHGDWPRELSELVPAYLEKLPADPFDGEPLRYVRHDDGITVYSVGYNRKDDGGSPSVKEDWRTGDIAFTLRRTPAVREG